MASTSISYTYVSASISLVYTSKVISLAYALRVIDRSDAHISSLLSGMIVACSNMDISTTYAGIKSICALYPIVDISR